MNFASKPKLYVDIEKKEDLDSEIKASGFLKDELGNDASDQFD